MDKKETVYREHSAKEHLILAAMILLAFAILTSRYNPEIWPSFTGTPTGAAAAAISVGSVYVWVLILLLLIIGIIAAIVIWWRKHQKIQVQRALQQGVDVMIKAAGKSPKPATADPLAKKLTKVEQELVNIPLRSATKGHIIQNFPTDYRKTPAKSASSLRHLFPRKVKVHKKAASLHTVKHRPSLQDKMMQIQKEIGKVKTRE